MTCVQGLWVLVTTKEKWAWAAEDISNMREVVKKKRGCVRKHRDGDKKRKGRKREECEKGRNGGLPFSNPTHFPQGPPAVRR